MDFLQSLLNSLPGAVGQGLIWGIMAIGVYITYRVLDVADLTVDGSLATGGAVCVLLMLNGMNAYLAMLCAVLAGMLAGLVTGLFHTRCGIPAILAGILTQLALYSINLRVMGWGTAAGTQATLAIRVDSYDLAVSSRYVRDLSLQNPIPLLAVGAALTQVDFDVIWRYFSWSNQTLAMITLWAAAMYLVRRGERRWQSLLCALPATFMSGVSCTYILMAEEGFRLSQSIAYPAGLLFAAACAAAFAYQLVKKAPALS